MMTSRTIQSRKTAPFQQRVSKPKALGPEHNVWFWNPNHPSVRGAPDWFRLKLREMGEELAITWNPINERWQVWARAPKIQHPICSGWRLLFIHQDADGQYLPLDERVFARLYAASVMAHGSAKAYFTRVVEEIQRDKERRERKNLQDQIDMSMPFFEHSQIKNIGKGNKFATYHA